MEVRTMASELTTVFQLTRDIGVSYWFRYCDVEAIRGQHRTHQLGEFRVTAITFGDVPSGHVVSTLGAPDVRKA